MNKEEQPDNLTTKTMKPGDKVKFTEASDEQVRFGDCDDPRKVLSTGMVYTIDDVDVHDWHTKIRLVNIDGEFNSVHFKVIPEVVQSETPKEFDFNSINDLRPYLLRHPDKDMIRSSCLHYMGDRFQQFALESETFTKSELLEAVRKAWEYSEEAANQCTCGDCDYCVEIGGPKITIEDYLKSINL